jgi:hypothetical protein
MAKIILFTSHFTNTYTTTFTVNLLWQFGATTFLTQTLVHVLSSLFFD